MLWTAQWLVVVRSGSTVGVGWLHGIAGNCSVYFHAIANPVCDDGSFFS